MTESHKAAIQKMAEEYAYKCTLDSGLDKVKRIERMSAFRVGAEALDKLLQPELEEKDKEILRLKESCKELNGVIDAWKLDFKNNDKEIERYKKIIEKFYMGNNFEKFCKENNITIQP